MKKSKTNKNNKTKPIQNKTREKDLSEDMPKQHYGGIKYERLTGLFFFLSVITLLLVIILVLSSHLSAHTKNIKSQEKCSSFVCFFFNENQF